VECEWKYFEGILAFEFKIAFNIIKQCFLVTNIVILLQMVVHSNRFGLIDLTYFLFLVHLDALLIGVLIDLAFGLAVFTYVISPDFIVDSPE